jgi:hypothetical protein
LDSNAIKILSAISSFSTLVPAIAFLLIQKNRKKGILFFVFFYCIFSFLTDLIVRFLTPTTDTSFEYFILTVFTVFELSLFSLVTYHSLTSKYFKKSLVIAVIAFVVFTLFVYLTGFNNDSLFASVECIIIISFCILYFYERLTQPTQTYMYFSPAFWILVGFFLYSSGTLFLFIYAVSLPRTESINYWYINSIFNLLKNIAFIIAFFMKDESSNTPIRKPFNIS